MERAREHEWVRLAIAAGLASEREPCRRRRPAGGSRSWPARDSRSELVLEAPEPVEHPETSDLTETDTTESEAATPTSTESFVDRIKAVLAA